MAWLWEHVFLFILFGLLLFRSHSYLVLLGRELLVLLQKIMSAFPAVVSLREGSHVWLDCGIMAQVGPSSWSRVMVFLFHHDMEIDEAAVIEYIMRRVVLMICVLS